MAFILADRVKESSVTSGTGSVVLAGPYGGFQSFDEGIGDGNSTWYAIENGIQWEVGRGTYSSLTNTLSRDSIYDSSNNSARINLAGVSIVFVTLPAAAQIGISDSGSVAVSGWAQDTISNTGIAVSGWAFETMTNKDAALSGYLEGLIDDISFSGGGGSSSGDIIALSGYLEQYSDNQDAAVSGWAGSTIISLSGWADTTMTDRDSQVSGWADSTMTQRDAALSGYLEDYVDSQDHGSSAVSGWVEGSLVSLSGWTDQTIQNNINAVSGWAGDTINNGDVALSGWTNSTIYSVSGELQGQIDQNSNDIITISGLIGSAGGDTFNDDLLVSLSNGKTFGRYEDGDTIPSSGLTAVDVITLAVAEPINPTVSLTSPSSVDFNEVNVNITLNFSHTINTVGGSVASASLEFRRGNSGLWNVLSVSTATPSSFNHVFTDTNFNTDVINYRYIVTDSAGASSTATLNIQPDTYSQPSISLTVTAVSKTSPETNNNRERGNVNTNLSGSITRNENFVGLQTYTLQYRVGNGSWTDLGSPVPIGPGNSAISLTNHNPIADNTATTLRYRVKVVDEFQTTFSSQRTVSLGFLAFYGPSASVPATSAEVRALSDRIFNSSTNTFNLNTTNTLTIFNVAIPDTQTISEVIDLDALNAPVTSQYINNPFTVDDAGGTPVNYNVYTMTIASPYSSNHRHQVTKG